MYNYHGFDASADVLVDTRPARELVEAAAQAVADAVADGVAPEHYVPGLGVVFFPRRRRRSAQLGVGVHPGG